MAADSKRKRKGCDMTANKNTSNLPFENTSTVDHVTDDQITSIYVKSFTGKTISLKVKPSDTIGALKLKIRTDEGIPVNQQALIFDGMVLDDTNTVRDFDIHNNSTIELMHKSRGSMWLFISIPKMTTTISLEAKPSDTIGYLKAKIWDEQGIPPEEHELIFGEMVLEDSGTLVDFHINKDSILKLMFKSRGLMKIFVKNLTTETEKIISLMVKPTDTISNVKDKIEFQEKIPRDKQVLIFNQVVLDDSGTLAEFHINMESTLILMRKSRGFIQIYIQYHDLNKFPLEVNTLDTIADLKAKIREKVDLPSCQQALLFDGRRLADDHTFAYYHIFEESTIDILPFQTGS